ncbi:MAG TPA: TfoX/Sxy family protein [Candidatus Limnocylindrales bacterium]
MPDREMPTMPKSPAALVDRFRAILDRYPDAQQRQMFGYPAAFVGGNMATSLFADRWIVRLPADEVDGAKAAGADDFEPMPGRSMKGFVAVPADDVGDDARIAGWVERGLAVAAAMPAKQPKKAPKKK